MMRRARLVQVVVKLAETVLDAPQPDPVQLGECGYADRVYVGLLGLREATSDTYEGMIHRVRASPLLQSALGLYDAAAGLPAACTVCVAADRLNAAFWRTMLALTTALFSLSGVYAIDAAEFDRSAASRRYWHRIDYTIQSLKTTRLIDIDSLAIIDVHCSTGTPHDTHIGWQVIKRNSNNDAVTAVLGDKGYDWADLRELWRETTIRPLIKHRKFTSLDRAHNARPTRTSTSTARRSRLCSLFSNDGSVKQSEHAPGMASLEKCSVGVSCTISIELRSDNPSPSCV